MCSQLKYKLGMCSSCYTMDCIENQSIKGEMPLFISVGVFYIQKKMYVFFSKIKVFGTELH